MVLRPHPPAFDGTDPGAFAPEAAQLDFDYFNSTLAPAASSFFTDDSSSARIRASPSPIPEKAPSGRISVKQGTPAQPIVFLA